MGGHRPSHFLYKGIQPQGNLPRSCWMKNFMKSNFENIFQSLRNCHKKLCLATHKLRKGDGQSPTFFLRPLKIFTMDILIIIHMELSITDILENTPVNNYCYPYIHFTFSRFICHREPVLPSFHRTNNRAGQPLFSLHPRQYLHF